MMPSSTSGLRFPSFIQLYARCVCKKVVWFWSLTACRLYHRPCRTSKLRAATPGSDEKSGRTEDDEEGVFYRAIKSIIKSSLHNHSRDWSKIVAFKPEQSRCEPGAQPDPERKAKCKQVLSPNSPRKKSHHQFCISQLSSNISGL